jgi:hypothetical protein
MAMVKPIAQTKAAFDATKPEIFSFTSSGGNQVVKNKITVRLNSDNTIVYTNTEESFAFTQTIPANKLQNGKYYNYFFNTFDVGGNMSPDSNVVSFYCYTAPTLTFTNVSNGSTIESSNFNFIVEYNQIEGELIDNMKIILYDINGSILFDSGVMYTNTNPPSQFSYSFNGMNNNTSYRIKAEGVTVNGTKIESQMITFEVRFENPAVYTKIDLENKCDEGYVQFRSNLVFIDAKSNPDPPVYVDGTAVDITQLGQWVEWMEGFEVPTGFILELWMTPSLLGKFCELWNKSSLNDSIKLNLLRNYYVDSEYPKDNFEVYAKYGTNYVRKYSNAVEALNNLSDIIVWVKKSGDNWELILDVVNRTTSVMFWNAEYESETNVEYNKITNLYWNDDFVSYIRYSPNANGSEMTINKESNSKYIGTTKVPFEEFEPEDPPFEGYIMNDNSYLADSFWVDYLSDTDGDMEFYTGSGMAPEDTWWSEVTGGSYIMDKLKYRLTPQMRTNFELARSGEYTFSLDIKCNKYGNGKTFSGYMGGEKTDGTMEKIVDFGTAQMPTQQSHIELKGSFINKNVDLNIYNNIWIVLPASPWNEEVGTISEIKNFSVYGKAIEEDRVEKWVIDNTKYTWELIPEEFAKDT